MLPSHLIALAPIKLVPMANSPEPGSKSSFNPPAEADWHRMIAEAAYYIAQQRGFRGEYALEDWLAAEHHIRQIISPSPQLEEPPDLEPER